MKVAIYGKPITQDLVTFIRNFLNQLKQNKVEFIIESNLKNQLVKDFSFDLEEISTFKTYADLDAKIELFFTLGGDGTILSAGTIVQDLNIPIVGINTGRLGFLATFSTDEFLDDLDEILSKKMEVSQRSLLSVKIDDEKTEFPFALNEIAVSRKETTSMITIETHMNGEFLNTFWADGLIISTPTGSTGYSLSCGGPIIDVTTKNFVITPIAPHNLNVRPFVIPDDAVIHLKIDSRAPEYLLSLDSRIESLSISKSIEIKKNPFNLSIVERRKNTYLTMLRKKLLFGSDQRN